MGLVGVRRLSRPDMGVWRDEKGEEIQGWEDKEKEQRESWAGGKC